MIIDSSAVMAIVRREPDATIYAAAIENSASACFISAASLFESSIVADRDDDPVLSRRFDQFLLEAKFVVVPFDDAQARIAREAYRDFGKGSRHKAQLNFGDCFAYALAKAMNEPLLYKGTDFSHTDVRPAL